MLTATPLYAGLLALLYLFLSYRVIRQRVAARVAHGDGGDRELSLRIRVHGNFNEYVPLGLILLAGAELQGAPLAVVHGLGAMLLAGRLAHAWGMSQTPGRPVGRGGGTVLTYVMLLTAALANIGHALF